MPRFTFCCQNHVASRFLLPNRCGRENVRIVNVKWRPALTKFTFVIRKPGGNIVEVPSCPTYLIGYLNCAEPCGHYRRTRRHAGDGKYRPRITTELTNFSLRKDRVVTSVWGWVYMHVCACARASVRNVCRV